MDESADICLRTTRSSTAKSVMTSLACRPNSAIPRITNEPRSKEKTCASSRDDDSQPSLEVQTMSVYLRLKPRLMKLKRTKKVTEKTFLVVDPTTLLTKFPSMEGSTSCTKKSKSPERINRNYYFTKVFEPTETQSNFFEQTTKRRILDFIDGHSFSLMTYGTINSGKTFTLFGNRESPGLIPRSIEFMFTEIKSCPEPWYKPIDMREIVFLNETARCQEVEARNHYLASKSSPEKSLNEETYRVIENDSKQTKEKAPDENALYSVWLSFVEIYNDSIYDLFVEEESREKLTPLKLVKDKQGRSFVQGMRSISASTGLEAYRIMAAGQSRLTVGLSNLNCESSRSHAIFTITLLKYSKDCSPENVQVSRMIFCDLAGTGRTRNSSSSGSELHEAKTINTSLLVLGKCLKFVSECRTPRHNTDIIGPFRESKLTRLFEREIMGKEKFGIIVNVDPSPQLYAETHAVLNAASMAKKIVTEVEGSPKPVIVPETTICAVKNSTNRETSESIDENPLVPFAKREIIEKTDAQSLANRNTAMTKEIAILQGTAPNSEFEIRQEMAKFYTNIMNYVEAHWQKWPKDVMEKEVNLLRWSATKLDPLGNERTDTLTHRKRRRTSGGDQLDDDDSSEALKSENSQRMVARVVALRKIVKKSKDELEVLSTENKKCVLELSMARNAIKQMRELINEEREEKTIVIDDRVNEEEIIDELKALIREKNQTIESLQKRLECRKMDANVLQSQEIGNKSFFELDIEDTASMGVKDVDIKFSSTTIKKESNDISSSSTAIDSIISGSAKNPNFSDEFLDPTKYSPFSNDELPNSEVPNCSRESTDNDFSLSFRSSSQYDSGIIMENVGSSSTETMLSCQTEEQLNQIHQNDDSSIDKSDIVKEAIRERLEQLKIDYSNLKTEHMLESHRVTELSQELESIQVILAELKESTRQNERKILDYQELLAIREKDLTNLGKLKYEMENRLSDVTKQLESRSLAYEEKIANLREACKSRTENENKALKNLAACQELNLDLESQLSAANSRINENSLKCLTEHVLSVEKLKCELTAKDHKILELEDKILKYEKDVCRLEGLNERARKLSVMFDEYRREKEDLKRQLNERSKMQSVLQLWIKRLLARTEERQNEITSLRTNMGDIVRTNTKNSDRARELSEEVAIAHGKLASARSEMARSEEERRKLERTSGHEIGNLIARLADFDKNATILARMRDSVEDSRTDELERLNLLLLEKDRRLFVLKKNRDNTVRRYEGLIKKLQADVEKRHTRKLPRIQMLHLKKVISQESLNSVTGSSLGWNTVLRRSVKKVRSSADGERKKLARCPCSDRCTRRTSRSYPTCSTIMKRSTSKIHAVVSSTSLEGSRSSESKHFSLAQYDNEDDQFFGQEMMEAQSRSELSGNIIDDYENYERKDDPWQDVVSIPTMSDESLTDFRDISDWSEIRRTTGKTHFPLQKEDSCDKCC